MHKINVWVKHTATNFFMGVKQTLSGQSFSAGTLKEKES